MKTRFSGGAALRAHALASRRRLTSSLKNACAAAFSNAGEEILAYDTVEETAALSVSCRLTRFSYGLVKQQLRFVIAVPVLLVRLLSLWLLLMLLMGGRLLRLLFLLARRLTLLVLLLVALILLGCRLLLLTFRGC